MSLDLTGVHPAHLVPFDDRGEIHEESLGAHVAALDRVDGLNAMVTNGHGAEVFALSHDERVRLVEVVDANVGPGTPVVSGLVAGSTREAVEQGRRLRDAGADAFLLFPPHTSINHRADAAREYVETVGQALDVPLVLFQHPVWAGGTYDSDLLVELAGLEEVVAVKNACWDMDRFQDDVYALGNAETDVQLLVANDEHLLASYALRADGTLLILAAVIPELIVDLFEAVQAGDLDAARDAYERADPFIRMAFGEPRADSNARLKKVLELQGTFPNAAPRPPAQPVADDAVPEIRRAMERVGLAPA
ncbi:dihydrodipicolinate synthase family protein [Halomicroarcula sp. GCM10025817]|uniref:dihydrodipicolinate synthase family protein n=1 Tax=Haloarcula TaxID=2237 RepID=UPI0023E8D6CB|nr:dihydrodipicolinate synthase family protein [Halomicroarcula sp. SYNS111]